jgi:hypothetical protein
MEGRYAHSLPGRPLAEWESLLDHLEAVAERAAAFAAVFGWAQAARVARLLHDIGKCSDEFFAYIKRSAAGEEGLRGPDHSTAGATGGLVPITASPATTAGSRQSRHCRPACLRPCGSRSMRMPDSPARF